MSLFRKLARRKASPSVPGPSSQEGATDLATSDDIATHTPLTRLPSTEAQQLTAETLHRAPDRSGHSFDRIQTEGASRNHFGDVFTKNVTYHYGVPFLSSEGTERQREDDDDRRREAARLEAERRLEEDKRLEFLKALKFDAMDFRLATIGPAHTKTCAWIGETPEYVRWRNERHRSEHHGVLWIKGKPGSGKSTLMKYALNLAQDRDDGDIVASFLFNARGQSLEHSAEGMYRSLLHQLLTELPHLYSGRTHIKQEFWSVEMLETMFQTSVLALKPDEHLVLYIDALDECVEDEVRDAVRHFEALADLAFSRGLRFSICFSSRHYPHITMHKLEELRLDDRDEHLEDISIYVHSNVGRLRIPLSAKTEIEAEINRRSLGIFLWAVLVIKILRERHDGGATLSELIRALATVPDKLASLFASILTHSDKGTITAFQWLLYARDPPFTEELYFAIKTSTNELSTGELDRNDVDQESIKRFITRTTRGLVEVVQHPYQDLRRITQFVHESVREHLLQGGLATLTMGEPHLTEGSSHAQIARCCSSYILLDTPKYLQEFEPHRSPPWFLSESFPLHEFIIKNLVHHTDLAYRAGALPLQFVFELPLRLLICISNISVLTEPKEESTTILFWLIANAGYALTEALLADCSTTEKPGIINCAGMAHSGMTFDINMKCDEVFGGALGAAAASGKIELVQQLLQLGAEVIPSEKDMCSPLIPATRSGFKDIVACLLQHGADVNAVSNSDSVPPDRASPETVLIIAVDDDDHDIVSMLLAYDPDLHFRGKYGTALDRALTGRNMSIIRLLWNAHFPESEWNRTLLACNGNTEEHRYDAVTVHDIKYYTGNEGNSGYETGSDDGSIDAFTSDDSYMFGSGKSITSAWTI